ncbi:MAG: TonB family protein [Gammaproteobacteria bacterium]|nr:TonB family protein [Gammaproteobacteria bacterium]
MPLDEYKTQVLLLHSEQSTLDTLSSGFSDSYTVHCATSGSEALNTLVDTPINVIVSAQELPGMSGLEALREAKKRSPDTVGILLAGNAGQGLEALVGDEEVFQVVRGNVTSDALHKLVDNATRQMRLMALAESANDTTANVDEPAQHIVMETSENGSTIISDGTGQVPQLDPQKVSAAASVGSRSVDVLVLTKDQEFLETIKDSSRGMHTVHYANTLAQADATIREHKVGVAVVDAAMVGDKVEQLTVHLRKNSSRLVSIVAGRRDDGEMLMDLINRGKVYRFLLKPVSPGRARLAVEASVKHHLEAPDAAFKVNGETPAPATKPVAKPKPAQIAKAEAAPKPKPQPKTSTPKSKKPKADASVPVDPPLGPVSAAVDDSPIADGLGNAFGQDDSSFTETVTGLISSVTKKFQGEKDTSIPEEPPPAEVFITESPANMELDSGGGLGGSLFASPKNLGIAGVAVAVVAAIAFWIFSGSEPESVPQQAEVALPTPAVTDSEAEEINTPDVASVDFETTLSSARAARDAGQLYAPAGDNAIELFATALTAEPGNEVATTELAAVIQQTLGMAETAMLESRIDDATGALQSVATVDAENPRLPFLNAQLGQMQLRAGLDGARRAIREERFEDAANALASARTVGATDNSEIDAVADELREARSAQQTDDVLGRAAARLESGQLLEPANDNAGYYYQLVLSNDPGNVIAAQGLGVIASKLASQARSEIDNGNLNSAEAILDDARRVDASSNDVATAITALGAARQSVIDRQAQEAAARRAAAERQAEADRQAAADRLAAERRLAEQQAEADRLAAERQAAEKLAAEQRATAAAASQNATENASESGPGAANTTAGLQQRAEPVGPPQSASGPPSTDSQIPVPVSSLTRTKYVAPKYPRNAQRRNQSGWVDVVFTVSMNGSVKDVSVRDSEPGETFVAAAVKAVEKWEFQPVIENGVLVEKKAGVRMMFALE